MAADVVVRAEAAGPVAHDDGPLTREVDAEEVAGLGQLLLATNGDPLAPPEPFPLTVEERLIHVGATRKRRLERAARHAVGELVVERALMRGILLEVG